MRYYLFQMPISNNKIFAHYDSVDEINMDDYVPVYTGEVSDNIDMETECENLFTMFNIHHPIGFAAHSLSTSDILMFVDESGRSFHYYCDWVGFRKLNDDPKFKA